MEAKALLIHPPYQGVCGLHGREDQCVTPGELMRFPGGSGISDPISERRSGKRCRMSSRTTAYYFKCGESHVTGNGGCE